MIYGLRIFFKYFNYAYALKNNFSLSKFKHKNLSFYNTNISTIPILRQCQTS